MGEKRAEALPGGSDTVDLDGVVGKTLVAVAQRQLAREHGADGAVGVADGRLDGDRFAVLQRGPGLLDQRAVEHVRQSMILGLAVVARDLRRDVDLMEYPAEIEAPRLPVVDGADDVQLVGAADHLVHGPEAEFGHDFADLLGDKHHVVHHVLGFSDEPLAEFGVLGGDAHRAGVQMALAHHDAALGDQRRCREAELVGAEQALRSPRRGRSASHRPPERRCGRAGR